MKKALASILSIIMILSLAVVGLAAGSITQEQAKQAAIDAVNAQYGTEYTIDSVLFERIDRIEFDDTHQRNVYDIEFYFDNGDGTYQNYDCDIDSETGELVGTIEFKVTTSLDDDVVISPNGGSIFERLRALINRIIEFFKSLFNRNRA